MNNQMPVRLTENRFTYTDGWIVAFEIEGYTDDSEPFGPLVNPGFDIPSVRVIITIPALTASCNPRTGGGCFYLESDANVKGDKEILIGSECSTHSDFADAPAAAPVPEPPSAKDYAINILFGLAATAVCVAAVVLTGGTAAVAIAVAVAGVATTAVATAVDIANGTCRSPWEMFFQVLCVCVTVAAIPTFIAPIIEHGAAGILLMLASDMTPSMFEMGGVFIRNMEAIFGQVDGNYWDYVFNPEARARDRAAGQTVQDIANAFLGLGFGDDGSSNNFVEGGGDSSSSDDTIYGDDGGRSEQAALDSGRPDLPEYDGTTTGVFISEDGQQTTFTSGGTSRSDPYGNYTSASHVEGQAATTMREQDISSGTIYHNNPNGTCNYCDKQLETLLPEDSTLTVVPPADATAPNEYWHTDSKTYTGNSSDPKPNPYYRGE